MKWNPIGLFDCVLEMTLTLFQNSSEKSFKRIFINSVVESMLVKVYQNPRLLIYYVFYEAYCGMYFNGNYFLA